MRKCLLGSLLLTLLVTAQQGHAAPLSTRFATNVGSGPVRALATHADRLLVGAAGSLYVVDVSGASPSVLGQVALGAEVTALQVEGSTAYAGTLTQGGAELYAVGLGAPAAPTVLGSVELGVDVSALTTSGTTLYVGVAAPGGEDPANGLRVVSIANPASLSVVRQGLPNTRIYGLNVLGSHLLGATNSITQDASILQVWDISTPSNPSRILGTSDGRAIRGYYVEVIGQNAVLGQYHGAEDREVGVFDLSGLPAARAAAHVGLGARSFAGHATGSYLFAGLEALSPTNLEIIDVSDAATTVRLEGYAAGTRGRVTALRVLGTTAYLGFQDSSTNLVAVDVSKYLGADAVAPTVSLVPPEGGAPLSGRVDVRAVASDNLRVTRVEFSVAGTVFATARTQSVSSPFNV